MLWGFGAFFVKTLSPLGTVMSVQICSAFAGRYEALRV